MGSVLHYVQRWLPLSAGFVHEHVVHCVRPSFVVSREAIENGEAFRGPTVISMASWLHAAPRWLRPDPLTLGLMAVAARRRAEIVHVHFGHIAPEVLGLCHRLKLPLVLSLHGDDITAFARSHPGHYEPVIAARPKVIVPSRFLAAKAEAVGFPGVDITVQPAGIDVDAFPATPLPDEPGVGFVGRLVPKKGLDVLLEAWPLVVAARPDARLHVVGDGPLAGLLASAPSSVTHELPDPGRRRQQVIDTIQAARIVVTPSKTSPEGDVESLLLVNLEAQASGRALVTTRHGGIPEFVRDGETALVVPEADATSLAEAIVRLLGDDVLCQRLAAAGPAHAAQFDVRQAAAGVGEVYEAALRDRRGRK